MNYLHILMCACYFMCYLATLIQGNGYSNFSLVSYNIHGLPMIMTFDETYVRMKEISQLLHGTEFDVINFQEDWTTHGNNILLDGLPEYAWSQRLNEYTHEYSLFGSGLLQMSKTTPDNSTQIVFTDRHGFDDMWANKGFQTMRIGDLDIYNTHLDAGKETGDVNARTAEIQQMINYINLWSQDRAILIGGDTNLRSFDNVSYNNLLNSLNLTEITNESCIDKFLYRNSSNLQIVPKKVISVKNKSLSDHSMIYLEMLIYS
jgi:endonuclease/exonuclease/phosphatase family metal-dependent hydrolase